MAPVLQNLRHAGQPRHAIQPNINRPVKFKGSDVKGSDAFGFQVKKLPTASSNPAASSKLIVDPKLQGFFQELLLNKLSQPSIPLSGINLNGMNTDVATVLEKLLARCEYGMDIDGVFQSHSNPFEFDLSHFPKAMLNGFDSPVMSQGFQEKSEKPKSEKPFKGLCHELAFAVAKHLEALPNQPYRFEMARVFSPQYFHRFSGMNHWAVLMSHPNKPEKQWLVDPSFGYAKSLLQATQDGYEILESHTLLNYETRRALEGHPMMLKKGAISLMPLGFVKNVFELSGVPKHWDKAMAYLGFVPGGEVTKDKVAQSALSVKVIGQQEGEDLIEPSLNLEKLLKPSPPLQRLLEHLRSQFRP